jgi:cytochrome c oxidase cbb3-type subunit 3
MSSACPKAARTARALLVILAASALAACEREHRPLRSEPIPGEQHDAIALATNSPGPEGPIIKTNSTREQYEKVAFHVSQGKKLFTWFNCNGCHANGGGGSGPALMDDVWLYGSSIENIAATIREGRPNGMPSFRGKIPEDQIWQIAAYVRALGGFVSSDVASSRHDQMYAHEGEARLPSPPERTSAQIGRAQPK